MSSRQARELYEAKQKAVKYYNENGVPKKIEEIMNTMFYDDPKDVYGYLSKFFETLSKPPTVSKVAARQAYDSKGQPTVQTEIYCTVKNDDKLAYTHVSSTPNSSLLDNVRVEEREVDDQQRQQNITAAITLLNTDINNRVHTLDPTQQKDIDDVIMKLYEELKVVEDERLAKEAAELAAEEGDQTSREADDKASEASGGKKGKNSAKKGKSQAVVYVPDEPKEKLLCGSNAFTSVSQAVCAAAAQVKQTELYKYLACLKNCETPEKFSVPLPMVTIIQSGRAAPGKLNCVKEFMVIPKHDMPLKKTATKLVNDIGALCPTFDKAEQGLDLLQEAITNCGLTAGEDFFIGLNCAGPEIFDYDPIPMAGKTDKVANFPGQDMHKEKGKYEVMVGIAKVADDVVEFWTDLLNRYPSIIALIDPLRKQEEEHWMRLCDKISDRCFVIGSQAYHRPGLLKDEELTDNFRSSGIVFKLEQINTISDIVTCVCKMEEADNQIVMSTCQGETTDTFISDFAVGVNARFIKIGAPVRGERTVQINRLLQIEEQLEWKGTLKPLEPNAYPHIAPPPLPEPEEGEAEVVEEEAKKEGKKK